MSATNGTTEVRIYISESAYLALVKHNETLMEALRDLAEIRDETESATLRLAMQVPLRRIGEAIAGLAEATRRD